MKGGPLDYILTFVKSDDPRTKIPLRSGEKVDYIPTQKLILPVDSANAISSGTIAPVTWAEWILNSGSP